MPLRPDFGVWLDILTETYPHETLRKRYAMRADDWYSTDQPEKWERIYKKLREKREEFPAEIEAVEGALKKLLPRLKRSDPVGEIVFEREGRAFYILENLRIFSNWKTTCVYINLDSLLKHGCISSEGLERQLRENARWKILRAASIYVILCAFATAAGDIIRGV